MYTFTVQRMKYEFPTLAECSETYGNVRDGLGLGMSEMRPSAVYQDGKRIGHISYNGRIWAGTAREWNDKTALLYDNRKQAAPIEARS